MRVLWTHNFDPRKENGLVFINGAAEGLRRRGIGLQLEYTGNLRSVGNLWRTRTRIKRMAADFDLIHAQYGSACALVTAAVRGIPKVLSIRGNDWNVHRDTFGFHYFHTRLARCFTRMSMGSFDRIVPVSDRIAAEIRGILPQTTIVTLPSPINLDRFVPRDKTVARELLGYSNCTEKWILFNAVDLNDPIKRFTLAKEAMRLAEKKGGNLRLRIASELPHADIPLFVAACDLILCTSETEGWPNSVKEALACNVPFVSTDVSDLQAIAQQEPSCRVCRPDAASLARGIGDSLAAPPADLRRHVAGMSLDASIDKLVGIYSSLTPHLS